MRKLIDIPQEVFDILTEKAKQKGMNLKRYIENLLSEDAKAQPKKKGFKFSSLNEPTDEELEQIMREASEMAKAKAEAAENAYFEELSKQMANALKS